MRLSIALAVLCTACAAPEIESDLSTDPLPLPPRGSSSGATSSGGSSGTSSGSSGTVAPPPTDQKLTVTLTASAGTVASTPTGLTCTGTTCTGTFARGTSVTLTTTPAAGAVFSGWSGACTGTATCGVKMDADVAVGADLVSLVEGGSWKGTYLNARQFNGCTFTNSGNVEIAGSLSGGGAFEQAGTVDGLELRQIPGCGLVGKTNGTAQKSAITLAGDTLTGTWTFAVAGASGSLAFPFTAKVKGKTITGSWTCPTCTGSFTLTKP